MLPAQHVSEPPSANKGFKRLFGRVGPVRQAQTRYGRPRENHAVLSQNVCGTHTTSPTRHVAACATTPKTLPRATHKKPLHRHPPRRGDPAAAKTTPTADALRTSRAQTERSHATTRALLPHTVGAPSLLNTMRPGRHARKRMAAEPPDMRNGGRWGCARAPPSAEQPRRAIRG